MTHPKISLLATVAVSAVLLSGSAAEVEKPLKKNGNPPSYGDCEVTGTKGEYTLETKTEGAVLMRADRPSPSRCNGDKVDDIRSGFDFCLLVIIASRAGIDNVKLEMAFFDGLVEPTRATWISRSTR